MFTADLSWTEAGTETVGQRRERKSRERSSTANSVATSTSPRSSLNGERERDLWWSSGLRKARTLKPCLRRPSSARSSTSQRTVKTVDQVPNGAPADNLRSIHLQPTWPFSNQPSPGPTTGNSIDLSIHEVPELEGDNSSRRTDSTEPRISRESDLSMVCEVPYLTKRVDERRWEVNTPTKIDIFVEGQPPPSPRSPDSFVTGRTRATSVATERELFPIPQFPRKPRDERKYVIKLP